MKKNLFISLIIFLILFLFVQNEVGKKDSILKDIKRIIPENVKKNLKENLFVFKNQKILKKRLNDQIKVNKSLEKKINEIPELLGFINFKNHQYVKNFKIGEEKFELKKFQTNFINISKNSAAKGTSYLEIFENQLIIANANGIFSYADINDLNNEEFNSKIIDSNIKKIINYDEFFLNTRFGIKDVLIDNENIYVSFSNQLNQNCFNTSIISAKINFEFLNFKNFYTPKQCVKTQNEYGEFSAFHAGGRMIDNSEEIIFSNGEYRFRTHAQNPDNVFGKILTINKKTKNINIVAMGVRNTQGLSYDKKKDILFMTEHGPKGGDEINIKMNLHSKMINFGWPISSYGEHYPHESEKKTKSIYKFAPLYKSHKKYGFEEPIKYYKDAIAPSEIIILDEKYLSNKNYINVLFGTLGYNIANKGQMSLHFLSIDEKMKIIDNNIIAINDRIRDLVYDDYNNQIILFLETTSSIGVLKRLEM